MSDDHHPRQPSSGQGGKSVSAQMPPARRDGDQASDAILIAQVATGSAPAFRTLIDRHLAVVVAVARNLLGDRAEAEDISQETFLRLWKSADGLAIGADGVRPWLRRVARNLAIDHMRSRKRLEDRDEVPDLPTKATQQDHVDSLDRRARVRQAIDRLPERQRVALTLFHFEAMSQADVAEAMDASQDAVESLLARGRRRLKTELEGDWRELIDEPIDEV